MQERSDCIDTVQWAAQGFWGVGVVGVQRVQCIVVVLIPLKLQGRSLLCGPDCCRVGVPCMFAWRTVACLDSSRQGLDHGFPSACVSGLGQERR